MEYLNRQRLIVWARLSKGFTLLEMILVVAIISIVALVSVPLGLNFYEIQMLSSVQTQLAEVLSRARSQSVALYNDDSYGVYMASTTSGQYVLFRGSTWVDRSATYDEPYDLPPETTVVFPATTTAIRFTKRSGLPFNAEGSNASGTIRIYRGALMRAVMLDDFGNVSLP